MANQMKVDVTLKIRHDLAAAWTLRNPILAQGEYGLEDDTYLLKIGDGVTPWRELRYLNKLDASYFTYSASGAVTFSDSFQALINTLINQAGGEVQKLVITNDPVDPTDAVNKRYLEMAIAQAGHLKRKKVTVLPPVEEADENTIYLVKNGSSYTEYMLIDDAYDVVGSINASVQYELPVATANILGGVKASEADNHINVTQTGFMTLNRVSTTLLYVPDGDELVLNGGNA